LKNAQRGASPSINHNDNVKDDEMRWACCTNVKRNACRLLVGKLEGKRPIGRANRWVRDTKMDIKRDLIGGGGVCGLVFRVLGYRSRGPGSISGTSEFSEKYWVWNRVHSAS
jgi:hypothetical protein